MQELEAVEHARGFEAVDDAVELCGVQAKHGAVATGGVPATGDAREEFGTHADDWAHAHGLRAFDDDRQFCRGFDDEDDLEAEFGHAEAEFDEFAVFVAVADDERPWLGEHGEGDHQFGFGAGFEAVLPGFAEADDVFDDLRLLVDFDGEDAAVFAAVVAVGDGFGEAFVDEADLVLEDVLHTQHHGHGFAAYFHAFDEVKHGDFSAFAACKRRADNKVAGVVQAEVARAPAADAVEFVGVSNAPGCFCVQCGFLGFCGLDLYIRDSRYPVCKREG